MPDAGYISTVEDLMNLLKEYDPSSPVHFNTEDENDMVLLSVYDVDDTVQIDVGPIEAEDDEVAAGNAWSLEEMGIGPSDWEERIASDYAGADHE